MEGKKVYQQPMGTVLDAINDIVELQNAKLTFSDTRHGKIHFIVKMYANSWEQRFTVTDIDKNQCNVKIEIEKEIFGSKNQIKREFALLDSMLNDETQIVLGNVTENNEQVTKSNEKRARLEGGAC